MKKWDVKITETATYNLVVFAETAIEARRKAQDSQKYKNNDADHFGDPSFEIKRRAGYEVMELAVSDFRYHVWSNEKGKVVAKFMSHGEAHEFIEFKEAK